MRGHIQVGSLRGIPIRVHFTFLLILPFLAWSFSQAFRAAAIAANVPPERLSGPPILWGLGVAVALFLSVLLHELAHSVYALAKGGAVSDISLMMIGGVSRITRMPDGARHEALMALAGPVTSLVLGALSLGVHLLLAGTDSFNLSFAFFYLGSLNIFLGVFNLLPAFPMDGGRILRALLTGKLGRVRATRVSGWVGQGFALLFGLYALLSGNFLLLFIAFFVFMGAAAESRDVLMQSRLGDVPVREVMSRNTVSVDASATLRDATELLYTERQRALPVVEGGRVVGLLMLESVRQVPVDRLSSVPVRELAQEVPVLTPDATAWEALKEMGQRRLTQLPVTEGGVLVGSLSQEDLLRALELRDLRDSKEPRQQGPWGFGGRENQSPT
ncbi:site-2 protease family protein [Melittangium boletus]|uniref:Zinc metalloprotease n=1 Tax=Melittangium boletus DSM 14713 TaxID=1294270 RepID=A0A250IDH1_9BACT|nr:site-2 protease family protein [Melittangium boletus]ATB29825.1 SREBP protease/CBS domain protein [Melittangium boletus DSM 14713]